MAAAISDPLNGSAAASPTITPFIAMTIDTLLKRYQAASQDHLLKFWSKITPEQQNELKSQLEALNVERVNRIYAKAVAAEAEAAKSTAGAESIEPLPKGASESVAHLDKAKEWRKIGLDAIARGEVGVLLMAGGQGTRLGSSAPKGCYDIGLPSHKSLFQYQAERIAGLQRVAETECSKPAGSVIIPWYVMTSGPTRRDTENFFKKSSYFGLDPKNVVFFEQGALYKFCPCLNAKVFQCACRNFTMSHYGRQNLAGHSIEGSRGPRRQWWVICRNSLPSSSRQKRNRLV